MSQPFLTPSQRAALVWASKNRIDGKHCFEDDMGRHLGYNRRTARAMAKVGLVVLEEFGRAWRATLTPDGETVMRHLIGESGQPGS